MTHDGIAAIAADHTAARNSGSAKAVAAFCAAAVGIVIDSGTPWEGRAGVARMAAGFFADVPDLGLTCDGIRVAGRLVAYLWTFTGHDATPGKPLRIAGWEEWDRDPEAKVAASRAAGSTPRTTPGRRPAGRPGAWPRSSLRRGMARLALAGRAHPSRPSCRPSAALPVSQTPSS